MGFTDRHLLKNPSFLIKPEIQQITLLPICIFLNPYSSLLFFAPVVNVFSFNFLSVIFVYPEKNIALPGGFLWSLLKALVVNVKGLTGTEQGMSLVFEKSENTIFID